MAQTKLKVNNNVIELDHNQIVDAINTYEGTAGEEHKINIDKVEVTAESTHVQVPKPTAEQAGYVLKAKNDGSTEWLAGGGGGTSDFDQLINRPTYNGATMSSTTAIPEVKTADWDAKSVVTASTSTATGDTAKSITIDGIAYNLGGAPDNYLVSATATTGSDNMTEVKVTSNATSGSDTNIIKTYASEQTGATELTYIQIGNKHYKIVGGSAGTVTNVNGKTGAVTIESTDNSLTFDNSGTNIDVKVKNAVPNYAAAEDGKALVVKEGTTTGTYELGWGEAGKLDGVQVAGTDLDIVNKKVNIVLDNPLEYDTTNKKIKIKTGNGITIASGSGHICTSITANGGLDYDGTTEGEKSLKVDTTKIQKKITAGDGLAFTTDTEALNIDLTTNSGLELVTDGGTDKKLQIKRASTDAGKYLKVTSGGNLEWAEAGAGDQLFWKDGATVKPFATYADFSTIKTSGTGFVLSTGTAKAATDINKGDYVIIASDESATPARTQARWGFKTNAATPYVDSWAYEYSLGSTFTGTDGVNVSGSTISAVAKTDSVVTTTGGIELNYDSTLEKTSDKKLKVKNPVPDYSANNKVLFVDEDSTPGTYKLAWLGAGNGITINDTGIQVKNADETLSVDTTGVKVAAGKFSKVTASATATGTPTEAKYITITQDGTATEYKLGGTDYTAGNGIEIDSSTKAISAKVKTDGNLVVDGNGLALANNVAVGGTLEVTGASTFTGTVALNETATVATGKKLKLADAGFAQIEDSTSGTAKTLQDALDAKVDKNTAITGATKCKITYDANGLVTAGADLEAADIPSLALAKISDVTATAAEVNKLAGLATTATELGYVNGVTSAIQTQLDTKVPNTRTINGKDLSTNITISVTQGALTTDEVYGTETTWTTTVTPTTTSVVPAVANGTASKATAGTAKTFNTDAIKNAVIEDSYADGVLTLTITTTNATTDSITPYTFADVNVATAGTAVSVVNGIASATTTASATDKVNAATAVANPTVSIA